MTIYWPKHVGTVCISYQIIPDIVDFFTSAQQVFKQDFQVRSPSSSFCYWHYNPLRVVAFTVVLFHSALSLHCCLIPIICISSSMPSIHLFLGLPLILIPLCFHYNTLLRVLLPSIGAQSCVSLNSTANRIKKI